MEATNASDFERRVEPGKVLERGKGLGRLPQRQLRTMNPGYQVIPATLACECGPTPTRARCGLGTPPGQRPTADETNAVIARGGWIVPRTAQGIGGRRASRM